MLKLPRLRADTSLVHAPVPPMLYHATTAEVAARVEVEGLLPRSMHRLGGQHREGIACNDSIYFYVNERDAIGHAQGCLRGGHGTVIAVDTKLLDHDAITLDTDEIQWAVYGSRLQKYGPEAYHDIAQFLRHLETTHESIAQCWQRLSLNARRLLRTYALTDGCILSPRLMHLGPIPTEAVISVEHVQGRAA